MTTTDVVLEAVLRARGLWNPDGVSRRATGRRCRDCGATILTGLDGDRCAGVARTDPTPLTPTAEHIATTTLGRTTYRLWWDTDHYELTPRGPHDITGTPPNPGTVNVVPSHQCGTPVSTLTLTAPHRTTHADTTGPPPY